MLYEGSEDVLIDKLLPHERLLMYVDEIDVSKISKLRSLDTTQNTVYVYGENVDKSFQTIEEFIKTLENGHTFSKNVINDNRRAYSETTFFITNDGFFTDRHRAIEALLQGFKAFAIQVQRMNAECDRSRLLNYNLKQSSIVIDDMLLFIASLKHVDNG